MRQIDGGKTEELTGWLWGKPVNAALKTYTHNIIIVLTSHPSVNIYRARLGHELSIFMSVIGVEYLVCRKI